MEDNRIQNQIAIYMTNKKLCEFTDKLKPAPIEYYAHMHAQGEEQADGIRAYSCIGVVLQDYSNGTGDKTVRVTANLSPGFFPFVLSRMQNDLDRFDFTEDMSFLEQLRALQKTAKFLTAFRMYRSRIRTNISTALRLCADMR